MVDNNIPTNPADLKAMKAMVVEMTVCLEKIDEQKEQLKLIAEAYEDKFGIKKKYITKMARVMYNHNYTDLQAENDHFETLYESVMESKIPNSTTDQE